MEKRHIVFVTLELPYPSTSGGRIYTWERMKILKSLGYDITLFSIVDDKEEINYEHMKNICSNIKTYRRENKYLKAIKYFWKPFSVATRFIPKMKKDLVEFIECNNIDLVIADSAIIAENCFNNVSPIILTQHNIEYLTFKSMANETTNVLKRIVYFREYFLCKQYEGKLYKNKSIIGYTFISFEDKKLFDSMYPNKNTFLIPMGWHDCCLKYNFSNSPQECKKIVFTGKMNYEPNVQAVKYFSESIFPKIKEKYENVKFYIVGKKPTKEVKDLELIKGIKVTGFVESTEKYLYDADIVVIPLLSGGGVKIKLFEALGKRKIVVTTSKGVEGTEFTHREDLLVADESNKFAQYCIEILSNKSKYEYLGDNGYKKLNSIYSWNEIGKKYKKFIESTITNRNN
ncbi:glycosyltransferase [Clostridium sp.]|uniref:glycosyltransferase n=1 Tax=Clostridium sp. TaxID=1506 RepID=UPI002609DFA2|nr:glycosyltransferase [Clostridium sp.]